MKKNYYFFTKGMLKRSNGTLEFCPTDKIDQCNDENLQEEILIGNEKPKTNISKGISLPINEVGSLFVLADVNFNKRLLEFLSYNQILMHIFNWYGNYHGSFVPSKIDRNGKILIKQVSHHNHKNKRLFVACSIAEASASNILKNLLYYKKKDNSISIIVENIISAMKEIYITDSIKTLLSIEAHIRKEYYSAFNTIINSDIKFTKREYHPPKNPMNALISFTYSLLYSVVVSEIYKTELNPAISFLHEPGKRNFPLALDLSDIFKPLLCDRIIFKTSNKKMINIEDFQYKGEACYLTGNGKKMITKEFDEKLNATIFHRKIKRKISYRRLIRLECYNLIKHIKGEQKYKAFKIWW